MVGLGLLPGSFFTSASGVSADGSVVVGTGGTPARTFEAFRWTEATGIVGLGDLPGGAFSSAARDVSADGTIIAGGGTSAAGGRAILWTDGGIVDLGAASANAISADDSVIVGSRSAGIPNSQAVRIRQLDELAGGGVTGVVDHR
jgi:probable HAF family extracellular repeat protein